MFAVSDLMKKTLIDAALIRFHRAKVCFSEFGFPHNQRGDNVVAICGVPSGVHVPKGNAVKFMGLEPWQVLGHCYPEL